MSIPEIRRNLKQEKRILAEIHHLQNSIQSLDVVERSFYVQTLTSLRNQLRMLNNAVLPLIEEISFAKPLDIKARTYLETKIPNELSLPPIKPLSQSQLKEPSYKKEIKPSPVFLKKSKKQTTFPKSKKKKYLNLKYLSKNTNENVFITLSAKDKENFAKELNLSEVNLIKLKKQNKKEIQKSTKSKTNIYVSSSNKFFSKVSDKLAPSFKDVKEDLKLSNTRILLQSYLSMALMSSSISFLGVLVLLGVLLIIDPSLALRSWYFIFLPIVILIGFYFYPSLQKGSIEKGIASELPFATIYMGAIAGSNVEPLRIFKIIANTEEYPTFGAEIKKIINQVELYGSDLVNALKNVAQSTTNRKFAELMGGMATNILSGGSLKSYLEKKAENFLMDYKLERQKYAAVAGTFMDIYISVLITAPLILMMVFVVIILTGMNMSLSTSSLFVISISLVVFANIIFLIILHLKQPTM